MKLSEVYTSIQGEGPSTGKPTTFVRFGGCNLRCPGWGTGVLPDGSIVAGCDTVFAVYPEWRGTWESVTPDDVLNRIPDEPRRICLTGGEPLIQRTKDLNQLAFALIDNEYEIDLFTNGSQYLPLFGWTQLDQTTIVMDYKLPGSGEYGSFDVRNLQHLKSKDALKFVCKHRTDFDTALRVLHHEGFVAQVWFGVVWGELEHSVLADWIQYEYPEGHLNIQTHKLIWDPNERKV